jgi:hypothetical protein
MLARDEHCSLWQKYVTYGRKMFYCIGPWWHRGRTLDSRTGGSNPTTGTGKEENGKRPRLILIYPTHKNLKNQLLL